MTVVTLKYVIFMMRADNQGEGGIMALMALGLDKVREQSKFKLPLLILGLLGASFFYGDGVITPAISVLSAVEGLEIISPSLKEYVIPVSIGILLVLFWAQSKGTGKIGIFFGPIMAIWFVLLGVLGVINIAQYPFVLEAINPFYAVEFLFTHEILSFFALGAVVLCLTGAEALYADMGHFGKKPIRIVWVGLVLPSIVLNYFGQGALLHAHPEVLDNLFYFMAPKSFQPILIAVATVATVIASQAVISGAFSMTKQAIQLGFLPRFKVVQTSSEEIGQIFVPVVNGLLVVLVIAAILYFKSSNALGSAYGIAVTGTMLITDFLAILVCFKVWNWSIQRAILGALPFIIIDSVFFTSNSLKFLDGGWAPIAISLCVVQIMTTWFRGKTYINNEIVRTYENLKGFIDNGIPNDMLRAKGTAVYLATNKEVVPTALKKTIYHFGCIHERVIILNIATKFTPFLSDSDRFTLEKYKKGFAFITVNYGFMESVNIPNFVNKNWPDTLRPDLYPISYFVYRQIIGVNGNSGLSLFRKKLFRLIQRNSQQPMEYFMLPDETTMVVAIKFDI